MQEKNQRELVITCESCKVVYRRQVNDYGACIKIYEEYQCPNGCGRNLYSFITMNCEES